MNTTSSGRATATPHPHQRIGVRRLLAMAPFRRLLLTRFSSQWAEGLFQAGLAGAVLFNPTREADPAAIAAGFAALLLPYSIIGPFAGALLDRWDRKRVLVVANVIRGTLILCCALAVAQGVSGLALFGCALAVLGVGRFVGAGLSAALPHTVPARNLVEANAVATTLGGAVAVFGGGCAVLLRSMFGANDAGSGATTAVAVFGCVLAGTLAARFAARALGPSTVDEPAHAMRAVARGLLDATRAVRGTPTVAAGLAALLAHRLALSISLLLSVLLMRHTFTDMGPLRAGLPGVGELAALGGAGILLAGLLTARLVTRFGRGRTICAALLLGALAQLLLGLPMLLPTVLAAALLITGSGQVVKLCVDAAVQRDIGDETRGRVFALYDMLFNITQVLAVGVAAMLVAPDGRSPGLVLTATLLYLAGIAGYVLVRGTGNRRDEHGWPTETAGSRQPVAGAGTETRATT